MNAHEAMTGEEILYHSKAAAGRIRFDNSWDKEDAEQEAALAMCLAKAEAKEGLPVDHFQRARARYAVLDFYNENKQRRKHFFLTLTKTVGQEDGTLEFIDTVTEEEGQSHMERLEATERDLFVDSLVRTLTPTEQTVLRLRFQEEKTLAEVGQEIDRTAEYVRLIQDKALGTLRHRWEHSRATA